MTNKKYFGKWDVYELLRKSIVDHSLDDLFQNNPSWEEADKKMEEYVLKINPDTEYLKGSCKSAMVTFSKDTKVYDPKNIIEGFKGDIHILSGEDGSLQYIHFCSICGTIILDDQSADYNYGETCSMQCPVCNPLKNKELYPFEYVSRKEDYLRWIRNMFVYAQSNKANFLSFKDRLNLYFNSFKKPINIFTIIKAELDYHKCIKQPFISYEYIAAEDCSKIKLGWK